VNRRLKIGISTCPNDTFAFHALLEGRIETPGLEWDFDLLDVEQLNEGLFRGEYDVAKASFHAALHLSDRYGVFASGSALGFGNGPLLLASKAFVESWLTTAESQRNLSSTDVKELDVQEIYGRHLAERKPLFDIEPALRDLPLPGDARTLCPGRRTTATFLFRTTFPTLPEPGQTVFSEIMPALRVGGADLGVCIHEGRFTWQEQELACIADLGTLWEAKTRLPLPLGGILGRLDLPLEALPNVQNAIRRSIEYGQSHREETLGSMRRFAQELADDVIWDHVDLYVNGATLDLGADGEKALAEMSRLATAAGLIPGSCPPLRVLR
jgi:1,4-dihydroxy-6-naphthoate synthase